MYEAEQEPVSAKSIPEGGKEIILQFLQGAVGCQLLFRNSGDSVMSAIAMDWPELGCRLMWGGTMCKDQPVARVLALEAEESEYMLLGESGQSWEGELGWCEIGLDVCICLDLKL